MYWYYAKGRETVGPVSQEEWQRLVANDEIRPETLVWNDELPAWVPYEKLALPQGAAPEPVPPVPKTAAATFAEAIRDADYRLSIRHCLREIFSLGREGWGRITAVTLFFLAFAVATSFHVLIDSIASFFIAGPFFGGICAFALGALRTRGGGFAEIALGFSRERYLPLVVRTLFYYGVLFVNVLALVFLFGSVEILLPGSAEMALGEETPISTSTWVYLFVGFAALLPTFYLSICWTFADLLIMDYRMSAFEAMRLSREKVLQHPWKVTLGFLVGAGLFVALMAPAVFTIMMIENERAIDLIITLATGVAFVVTLSFFIALNAAMYEVIFTLPVRKRAETGERPGEGAGEA